MSRRYRDEFPDFDYDIPELPDFRDESWHQDVCPRFVSHDDQLLLWVNYLDPTLREDQNEYQFMLCNNAKDSFHPILYQSNDWDSLMSMLRLIRLSLNLEAAKNSKPTVPVGSHRIVEIV